MKAIYTNVNGKKIFIGKHIEDSIVREFSFASATLWQNESLSFDKKLLKYAEDKGVESFIFSDPKKRIGFGALRGLFLESFWIHLSPFGGPFGPAQTPHLA